MAMVPFIATVTDIRRFEWSITRVLVIIRAIMVMLKQVTRLTFSFADYKLADGTYMDRIERRFTYNGTDTWIDEDGAEWNAAAE